MKKRDLGKYSFVVLHSKTKSGEEIPAPLLFSVYYSL
jgi:hypothetical protein